MCWRYVVTVILAGSLEAGSVHGRVVDASSGEALAKAQVRLGGADRWVETGRDGRFEIEWKEAGEVEIQITSVGYRPLNQRLVLTAEQPLDLEVALQPDTLRKTETVEVRAPPFAGEEGVSLALAGQELRNLASVLADDPMRAVQALPGVTANDDFTSQFALRGAGFQKIGLYLDGVLLHTPFHAVQAEPATGSLTIVEAEVLEAAQLHPGPLPVRYLDRTAGVLDFRMREGDRRRTSARATASTSTAGASAEGRLGGKGSWLAALRKSYLQYLIARTSDDPTIAFGFWDAQGKLAWQLNPAHQFTLAVLEGHSGLDRRDAAAQLGLNAVVTSAYHFTLANAAWRYSRGSAFTMTSRAALLRERFDNRNRDQTPMAGGGYGEWAWYLDGQRYWNARSALEFGAVARRVRDDGFADRLLAAPQLPRRIEQYRGAGVRSGGYAQESWSPWKPLSLTVGGRVDHHDYSGTAATSPYAAAALSLWEGGRLYASWGQAVQFPEIAQFTSIAARRVLAPERSTSAQVSLEQAIGERTRVRLEAYNRQDRDLLFRPWLDPRLVGTRVVSPPLVPEWENSQRGWARGFQAMVQRRAANGWTGWVAYAYGKSWLRDGTLGLGFPSDYDQRHSVRVFSSYRLRPTVNLSGRASYGSGTPVPGFFEKRGADYYLSAARNRLRLPDYFRWDFRVNKAIVRRRAQVTLFLELVNITNRRNLRFDNLSSYDTRTGRARVIFDRMLPVLPAGGLVVDF